MIKQQISNFLIKERKSRNISQQKFSEILDIHPNYLGGLERQERNPSIELIQKIALKLNRTPKIKFDELK